MTGPLRADQARRAFRGRPDESVSGRLVIARRTMAVTRGRTARAVPPWLARAQTGSYVFSWLRRRQRLRQLPKPLGTDLQGLARSAGSRQTGVCACEGLISAAERAMPARKPSVKIKVASTIRALPSPCTIEIDVFLRNAHEPVLLAIVLYSRRTRPLLSQIIAPDVILSPLGNGRAHITICNAEMAWWCRHGNALV
jgi:hypothetical protein